MPPPILKKDEELSFEVERVLAHEVKGIVQTSKILPY